MAKKTTAIKVMIVVFFTSLAVGHDTLRISARVSRRNCAVRWKNPVRDPANPRPRRVPLPSARGDGVPIGLVTEVSRAGAGSGKAPKFSVSSSSIDTRTSILTWQGYQDSNPDFRFWRP